jgi:pimeloyl-ACP methyl ester carboxylesterase
MTAIVSNEGPSPANRDGLYAGLANKMISAANGIDYAYRDTGPGASGDLPLVLLQHFRGNLDNWDPALVDALVRRLILASSAPRGAAGMHGWAPEVIGAVGKPETRPEDYLQVFFAPSSSSQKAGQEVLGRIYARTQDRDKPTTWATREAQYDAVCDWGIPDHSLLQRLSGIDRPVFVANGDSDPMILPHYSYLIAGLIPQATVKIYPDAAHGFLFQHHAEFAADVEAFLSDPH